MYCTCFFSETGKTCIQSKLHMHFSHKFFKEKCWYIVNSVWVSPRWHKIWWYHSSMGFSNCLGVTIKRSDDTAIMPLFLGRTVFTVFISPLQSEFNIYNHPFTEGNTGAENISERFMEHNTIGCKSIELLTFILCLKVCEIHGKHLLNCDEYINNENVCIMNHKKRDYYVETC